MTGETPEDARGLTEPWQIRSVAMELAIKAMKDLSFDGAPDLVRVAEDIHRFLMKNGTTESPPITSEVSIVVPPGFDATNLPRIDFSGGIEG